MTLTPERQKLKQDAIRLRQEMGWSIRRIAGQCIHYWKIANPDGPQSKGVCQKCGKERMFENHFESLNGFPKSRIKRHQQIVLEGSTPYESSRVTSNRMDKPRTNYHTQKGAKGTLVRQMP